MTTHWIYTFTLLASALAFTWLGWNGETPSQTLSGSSLGLIFWGLVAWHWIIENSATATVHFGWGFVAPILFCMVMIYDSVLNGFSQTVEGKRRID